MFCCFPVLPNSRLSRQCFNGKENLESVETKAFRKLFSDVPLFGISEDAEIGINHFPGDADVKAAVDYSNTNYCHRGAAIFVILYFP